MFADILTFHNNYMKAETTKLRAVKNVICYWKLGEGVGVDEKKD